MGQKYDNENQMLKEFNVNKLIMGYSERGIINALVMDIAIAKSRNDGSDIKIISNLSSLFLKNSDDKQIIFDDYQIWVEPSFSDFGDSDLIILLLSENKLINSFFLEAKISGYNKKYEIRKHFEEFRNKANNNQEGTMFSSNLFVQLYHKYILLRNNNNIESLEKGINFPIFSTKIKRKIGENIIVKKIVKAISNIVNDINFENESINLIALIPGNNENNGLENLNSKLVNLDSKSLNEEERKELNEFMTKISICYFTSIYNLSNNFHLPNFKKTYEFNREQIEGKFEN